MMTLSNGLLVSSTPLPGGMRRDLWKLDLPHAPYLAMIAVGQWDKVTDYWRGRPVDYYVDLGYGPSARAIFANTPEMIEFFSTQTRIRICVAKVFTDHRQGLCFRCYGKHNSSGLW